MCIRDSFGAFIGCAVGAFMILIIDPMRALWFVILFLVLQQIEGNLIYPKVVGGSVGLPSIWVLVAVTIGGSTMGIAGMPFRFAAASSPERPAAPSRRPKPAARRPSSFP